jgi:hypothetical protein
MSTAKVINDEGLTGFWGHFNHTHSPIRTHSDCSFVSEAEIGLHFDATVSELQCQFELLNELILILKSLGIYETSTIIFKSDHGRSNDVYLSKEMASLSSLVGNIHQKYAAQRYQPILLIKPSSQLSINNSIFDGTVNLLGDLSKTYCVVAQTMKFQYEGCEKIVGRSFVRSSSDVDQKNDNSDNSSAYVYVPKNMNSTHMFGDLQPRKVMRNVDIKNFDQFVLSITQITKETVD